MFALAWPGAGAKPHGWELKKVKVSPSTASGPRKRANAFLGFGRWRWRERYNMLMFPLMGIRPCKCNDVILRASLQTLLGSTPSRRHRF